MNPTPRRTLSTLLLCGSLLSAPSAWAQQAAAPTAEGKTALPQPGTAENGRARQPAPDDRQSPGRAKMTEREAAARVPETVQPNSFEYYHVTGIAFRPRVSATTYGYTTDGCVFQSGGTDNRFVAPLLLPDGAIIKFLRIYYNDTNAADLTGWITKYDAGVSNLDITSATSTGTGGFGTTLSPQVTEVVDNAAFAYVLTFGPGVATSGNQFCGARVAYYPGETGVYTPVAPCRVIDTRVASAQTTGAPLPNPGPHDFRIQGNCGIRTGAKAVVLNATVVAPSLGGDLRMFPFGGAQPPVSVLNYPAGIAAIANGAAIPLGTVTLPADKDLSVLIGMAGSGAIHLLIDVTGYYY